MEAAHQVIERLGSGDEFLRLRGAQPARVGKAGEIPPVGFQVPDGIFRTDEDHDGVPAFIGFPDLDDIYAGRLRGQRAVITE